MIHDSDSVSQKCSPRDEIVRLADNCPTCGKPYLLPWPPFHPRASALLDQVTLAHDAIAALQAALEAEVLP